MVDVRRIEGTGPRFRRFVFMDTEDELRDAAARCRRLARDLVHLDALAMIALAYEYDERADAVARLASFDLVLA